MFPASDDCFTSISLIKHHKRSLQQQPQQQHRRIYIDAIRGKAIFLPSRHNEPLPPASPHRTTQKNTLSRHFPFSLFAENKKAGGTAKVVPMADKDAMAALEQEGGGQVNDTLPGVSFRKSVL